jgi:hypothetical protein
MLLEQSSVNPLDKSETDSAQRGDDAEIVRVRICPVTFDIASIEAEAMKRPPRTSKGPRFRRS